MSKRRGLEAARCSHGDQGRNGGSSRVLVSVLANPPLTSGVRTMSRVELAGRLLGFGQVRVVNLFALPSRETGEIATLGRSETGWLEARRDLRAGLAGADGVLLAYGASAPTGAARGHFMAQLDWLESQEALRNLPKWWVGDGPRHPSRWQRWTSRAFPDAEFNDALAKSLSPVTLAMWNLTARRGARTEGVGKLRAFGLDPAAECR